MTCSKLSRLFSAKTRSISRLKKKTQKTRVTRDPLNIVAQPIRFRCEIRRWFFSNRVVKFVERSLVRQRGLIL